MGIEKVASSQKENLMELHPNPASDYLIIQSSQDMSGQLTIYNNWGQQMLEKNVRGNQMRLNIKNLSAGLYRLQYRSEDGALELKVFVKH